MITGNLVLFGRALALQDGDGKGMEFAPQQPEKSGEVPQESQALKLFPRIGNFILKLQLP